MSVSSTRRTVLHVTSDGVVRRVDALAVEEPLTVRIDDVEVLTTMRTPGHDLELAIGWLVAEGVVAQPADVGSAKACRLEGRDGDLVDVVLRTTRRPAQRLGWTSSACGTCGTEAIDLVVERSASRRVAPQRGAVVPSVLASLPDRLRAEQRIFARTGGLHAAGLFSLDGELQVLREDVGRHNAVDKVLGWALAQDALPLHDSVLQLSGRASFELVQKAAVAGVPVVCAVSAPSSLAVRLAEATGVVLAGFVRDGGFNLYTGFEALTTGR